MFKKEPSEGMKAMYQSKREATARKIQQAIDLIQSEDRLVTRKELLELTGLSSGSLSQDYIKEILKENQVCQFRPKLPERAQKSYEKTLHELEKENSKLKNEKMDLELRINRLEKRLSNLGEDNRNLQERLSLLSGKYQQVLEYLEVTDNNINSFL